LTRNARSPRLVKSSVTEAPSHIRRYILVGLIILAFGLGVWSSFQVKSASKQVLLLRTEASSLGARHAELQKTYEALTSRASLERMGKRLGLHPPKKEQLIFLD